MSEGIEQYYSKYAPVFIDPLDNGYMIIRLNWLKDKMSSLPKSIKILDVGSWTGTLINEIYKEGFKQIDCLELCTEATLLGKSTYPQLTYINASVRLFDTDKRYDVILACEVLEHLDKPMDTLLKLRGWLNPGGILLISVPAVDSVLFIDEGEHINKLTIAELKTVTTEIDILTYAEGVSWYSCIVRK